MSVYFVEVFFLLISTRVFTLFLLLDILFCWSALAISFRPLEGTTVYVYSH